MTAQITTLADAVQASQDAMTDALSDTLAKVAGAKSGDESPDMAFALDAAIAQYVRDWWLYNVAQRLTIVGTDFSCSCGNLPNLDGFNACNNRGIEVGPVTSAWPIALYVCQRCGTVYHVPAEAITEGNIVRGERPNV